MRVGVKLNPSFSPYFSSLLLKNYKPFILLLVVIIVIIVECV